MPCRMEKTTRSSYTCRDYRQEMQLLGLKKRLQEDGLDSTEKTAIEVQVKKLEKALGLD